MHTHPHLPSEHRGWLVILASVINCHNRYLCMYVCEYTCKHDNRPMLMWSQFIIARCCVAAAFQNIIFVYCMSHKILHKYIHDIILTFQVHSWGKFHQPTHTDQIHLHNSTVHDFNGWNSWSRILTNQLKLRPYYMCYIPRNCVSW